MPRSARPAPCTQQQICRRASNRGFATSQGGKPAAYRSKPIQNNPGAQPQNERVSPTRVSGWDQESMQRRVLDPSAHADGTDLVAPEAFAA